jgi:hypothetical protein
VRRRLVTLAFVGLFAACGFPEVTYQTDGGDGGNPPDSSTSAESSSGDDGAPSDVTTGGDGSSSGADAMADAEASTATDAAGDGSDSSFGGDSSSGSDTGADAPGESSTADAPPDVVEAGPVESGADAPVDAPADVHDSGTDAPPVCDFDMDTYKVEGVAACGTGNDCCDTDNTAHPNQANYFTKTDACGSFDYNCSGAIEPEFLSNLSCGGTGALGCTGGSAFLGPDPGCGNTALYGTCMANGLLACQAGDEMMVQQACH